MNSDLKTGIVTLPSQHTVEATVEKLKSLLQANGIKLFAHIDHSGEARAAGLELPPTELLIFGNPQVGTPLMIASRAAALDLPLKILVWEDPEGKAWLSYNSPQYLQERHGLPRDLLPNMAPVEKLAAVAAQ